MLISFGGQEVFVVSVAIYFCAQTVLETTLYMGTSMVKALIVKVFRARRKDTTTNVMSMHLYQPGKLLKGRGH